MNDGLKLQLEVEFWGSSEPAVGQSSGMGLSMIYQQYTSQRQVSIAIYHSD